MSILETQSYYSPESYQGTWKSPPLPNPDFLYYLHTLKSEYWISASKLSWLYTRQLELCRSVSIWGQLSEWRIFLSFFCLELHHFRRICRSIINWPAWNIFNIREMGAQKIPSRETTFSDVHHGAVMIRQNRSKQDNIHLPSQGTCWSRQRFVCPKCQKRLWQSRDTCSVAHNWHAPWSNIQ